MIPATADQGMGHPLIRRWSTTISECSGQPPTLWAAEAVVAKGAGSPKEDAAHALAIL
jgi:hypothetical protein